jgi:uncharacterized membrane protein
MIKVAHPGYRWIAVKFFKHWRSKKLIIAENYGKECFWLLVRA